MIPVVIAGAGPVGLSLAVGLAHHGVRSVVLEQGAGPPPHSRAPGIMPRTLEILREWGLLEVFMREGELLEEARVTIVGEERPRVILPFDLLREWTSIPGPLILRQDRTEALLVGRLRELGLGTVRWGHRVTGFVDEGDRVRVRVSPAEGEAYELEGAYLAGCDGAHSTVRERLGWHLEGKTYPVRLMLADVTVDDARDMLAWPRVYPLKSGALAALRLEPGLWRIISSLAPDEPESVGAAEVAWRAEALLGPGPAPTVWASAFHIHCRTSPHFRRGRVVIAGDAAHLNSPAGGQGMNAGIQDAHNLAWKLKRALGGANADRLLGSYEAERRATVLNRVDGYTDFLTRNVLLGEPRWRGPFLAVLERLVKQPWIVRQIMPRAAMLDTDYSRSPLVAGSGPALGHRAPDGTLRDAAGHQVRVLELAGKEAALLLFDDGRLPGWDVPAVRELLREVPGVAIARVGPTPDAWRDVTGAVGRGWHARAGTAALVRPDGFVGWRSERPMPEELLAGVRWALGETPAGVPAPERVSAPR